MGMVVRTNMAGLNANNALNNASKTQQNAMQKLASGFRINKAADDASGLAISEKMKNQIKALDTAADNCEDGANMIQTAEGYMAEAHDMVNRMVELSEKAANGVLDQTDRDALQDEMDELCAEIDRMATTANFNGKKLLDGSIGSSTSLTLTVEDNQIKYNEPTGSELKFGGGLIEASKQGDSEALKNGVEYMVNTDAEVTEDDLTKCTVEVVELDSNGDATDNVLEITITAKKGDTVTINEDGEGTSKNGLTFEGFASYVGGTFTFDGENWLNDQNVALTDGDGGTMKATLEAEKDKFVYQEKAAAGDSNDGINLQIGESSTSADRLEVTINSFHSDVLFKGLDGFINSSSDTTDVEATATVKINMENTASTYNDAVTINIKDQDNASAAADALRQVSNYISDERGKLGAQQNRLEHTVNNLTTASENITAANSRIRDTNMAEEMMNYTSKNVIAQAAQAMLAQANSQPQNVLSLLQ